ncbi:MAG TPA: CAP domain-containing protein [Candidatus Angelobacter sp.]|nr:CAP domain-containing protein [Candidatus Angelobacter sp.]
MKKWLGVILMMVCLAAMAAPRSGPTQDEQKLFDLVNQEREKAGLPRLQWENHLAESARGHAQQLSEHERLSHQYPGEPEMGERIAATGLRFNVAGENVAYAPTVEIAHEDLMASPPHRANILNSKYNALGLAVIVRGKQMYVAQNFAHVIPEYSESQFRDAVTGAIQQIRRAKSLPAMQMVSDSNLRDAACSGESDPKKLITNIPGALHLEIFTSSTPDLPDNMQSTAAKFELRRMNIGVCFKPGREHGYASFEVVAAFFLH